MALKLIISIFLIIISIIGYSFYDGTAFGDYLNELSLGGQLVFVAINFILSNVLVLNWISKSLDNIVNKEFLFFPHLAELGSSILNLYK